MYKLTRRALLTSAATLPVLAISARAASAAQNEPIICPAQQIDVSLIRIKPSLAVLRARPRPVQRTPGVASADASVQVATFDGQTMLPLPLSSSSPSNRKTVRVATTPRHRHHPPGI
jgi:hypothetical protein